MVNLINNEAPLIFTRHAIKRMNTRNITIEDVMEALESYKQFRRQAKEGYEDSYVILGRNKVQVVLNLEKTVVITVHKFNTNYGKARNRHHKNKKRKDALGIFGNRVKR